MAFDSESEQLSEYIMEELTGALVNTRMEVADRSNLAYVYKELNFQASGDVSDESAQSIGKFLAAELVVTGELINTGPRYRLRVSSITVETAIRAASTRLNVRKDQNLSSLIAALGTNKRVTHSVNYGVAEKKGRQKQRGPSWTGGLCLLPGANMLWPSRILPKQSI